MIDTYYINSTYHLEFVSKCINFFFCGFSTSLSCFLVFARDWMRAASAVLRGKSGTVSRPSQGHAGIHKAAQPVRNEGKNAKIHTESLQLGFERGTF